jgi:hypothetical protein
MYKTDFVVKYHDIENELILNLHRKMMRQHELEDLAEKEAAAAKAAAILEKENQIKALEEQAKKQLEEQAKPVKKKGGKKKVEPVLNVVEEAPKKRGRKKATKAEEPVIKVEEVVKTEEIKLEVKEEKEEPKVEIEEPKKDTDDANEDDDDDCEDLEYTMDDVHLICEKLYRDELLSVFEVETINDPNMDAGIKRVIEKMIDNKNFKQLLDDIKHELIEFSNPSGTPEELENIRRNLEYLIFITLFSQQVFYITHKCICQLFTVDDVDPNLIDRLKDKTIGLFKRN